MPRPTTTASTSDAETTKASKPDSESSVKGGKVTSKKAKPSSAPETLKDKDSGKSSNKENECGPTAAQQQEEEEEGEREDARAYDVGQTLSVRDTPDSYRETNWTNIFLASRSVGTTTVGTRPR